MYVLYSVSLCCFVYCLCVNVYLQLPPGLNPIAFNKIYNKYRRTYVFMRCVEFLIVILKKFGFLQQI